MMARSLKTTILVWTLQKVECFAPKNIKKYPQNPDTLAKNPLILPTWQKKLQTHARNFAEDTLFYYLCLA